MSDSSCWNVGCWNYGHSKGFCGCDDDDGPKGQRGSEAGCYS